jgi:hypothetical protein
MSKDRKAETMETTGNETSATGVAMVEAWLEKRGFDLQTERRGLYREDGDGYFARPIKGRLGPEWKWVGIGWRGPHARRLKELV